jgi:hypothetical protein
VFFELLIEHPNGRGMQRIEVRMLGDCLQPSAPLLPGILVNPPLLVELVGLLYDPVGYIRRRIVAKSSASSSMVGEMSLARRRSFELWPDMT